MRVTGVVGTIGVVGALAPFAVTAPLALTGFAEFCFGLTACLRPPQFARCPRLGDAKKPAPEGVVGVPELFGIPTIKLVGN